MLAFGRALGETMALAMLVGNTNQINCRCFRRPTPCRLLANNFPEAGPSKWACSCMPRWFCLAITLVVNIVGALHSPARIVHASE